MMTSRANIAAGHDAFRRQNWKAAYERLSAADREAGLDAESLETLANAAYLIARDKEATEIWARAHNALIDRGEVGRAARVGFLLSLTSLLKGEGSKSGGWLARTRRLLDGASDRHVEVGFCMIVLGLRELHGGDYHAALQKFESAVALATDFQDPDLLALSLLSEGQALIELGQSERGTARLDEAMVSVTAGEVAPIFSGIVYCAVILTCQRIFDTERAREWTRAFNEWCEPQPELVLFRGQCLIHRSEILQMRGDWPGAMEEAERACHRLNGQSEATVGRAHYQKGELHRLFGEFDSADRSYQEAVRYGFDPQPGHALLRLGGGQTEAAAASIRTACGSRYGLSEFGGNPSRLKLLGPSVEIFLSAGETDTAIAAAEELAARARAIEKPLLEATSAAATGAVLATTDQPEAAIATLKKSLATWQRLGMPYEAARARVKLAEVCHRLGDRDSAGMHFDAARFIFRKLGASPDLTAMDRLPARSWNTGVPGLTDRQLDVLRLLANGQSNREIASELRISEHTVARHVSNIFDKTGVTSRAAAVAHALRQNLLR
ncbi:MAG: helix-turn-helix transcriptional regulator [Pseudomonadota bacterium]